MFQHRVPVSQIRRSLSLALNRFLDLSRESLDHRRAGSLPKISRLASLLLPMLTVRCRTIHASLVKILYRLLNFPRVPRGGEIKTMKKKAKLLKMTEMGVEKLYSVIK